MDRPEPPADHRRRNYVAKVEQFVRENAVPAARFSELLIAHDDWCRIFSGGYCNCVPHKDN